MRTSTLATLVAGSIVLAAPHGVPHAAHAVERPITSTTQLERACETSPDRFLYVTLDVNITSGPPVTVDGPCQIALGPSASFAADGVSVRFTGAFRMDGSRGRSMTFRQSTWRSTTMELYNGDAASFGVVASLLEATAGRLVIGSGTDSTVLIADRPAGSRVSLRAAGSVTISGGKQEVALRDSGVQAGTSARLSLGGAEAVLKAERAEIRSLRGPLTVTAPGKALVELKSVTLSAAGGSATIGLSGSDASIIAEGSRIASSGGDVRLDAGTQGMFGRVEMSGTTIDASGRVSVHGSSSSFSRFGTVKVGRSTITGGSDVLLATGPFGQTEVKESALRSSSAIRVRTGPNGSCTAEKNALTAPVQQICA